MMTPQQLRNSILQRAIEGKLVEQRPEEGTAEDLLVQIQTEKAQLIKDKKLKKDKPLDPIAEDEIPFEIPESWKWVHLSDVTVVNPSVNYDDEIEVSFIPMTKVEAGYVSKISNDEVKLWKEVKSGFSKFQDNDLLVAKITPCFQNRKSAIASGLKNSFGAGSTELTVVRGYEGIDNKYLLFFVKSGYFIDYGVSHFAGTAGQQRFGGNAFKAIPFPLPPLPEQQRIVAKIEELMPLVDRYEKAYSSLETLDKELPEKLKQAVLQYAIEGKLVEQRPEEGTAEDLLEKIQAEKALLIKEGKIKKDKLLEPINEEDVPFEIPENWKWVKLNDLFNFIDYRGHTPIKSSSGVRLITASNVRKGFIDNSRLEYISEAEFENRKSRGISRKGDLLFTTEAPLGNAAIADLEVYSAGQRVVTFQAYYGVVTKLFVYFILSTFFQQYLISESTGSTVKGIKAAKLKNMLIPLPPLSEQQRIVTKIEKIFSMLKVLEQS